MRIRHVAVVVADMEKTAAFYEDVLGFKNLGSRQPNHFPGKAIDLSDGEIHFSLIQPNEDLARSGWSQGNIGPNHIGVEVEDPNGVASRLEKYGIELIGARYDKDSPDTLRYFKFRDPEGVEVDVSSLPGVWRRS